MKHLRFFILVLHGDNRWQLEYYLCTSLVYPVLPLMIQMIFKKSLVYLDLAAADDDDGIGDDDDEDDFCFSTLTFPLSFSLVASSSEHLVFRWRWPTVCTRGRITQIRARGILSQNFILRIWWDDDDDRRPEMSRLNDINNFDVDIVHVRHSDAAACGRHSNLKE